MSQVKATAKESLSATVSRAAVGENPHPNPQQPQPHTRKLALLLHALAGAAIAVLYVNCSELPAMEASGSASTYSSTYSNSLMVTLSSATVAPNGTVQVGASGGTAPYTYSLAYGSGTISASTGLYTAPSTDSSATIMVTDANSYTGYATIVVETSTSYSTSITVTASATSLFGGQYALLYASGGTQPYTFSLDSTGFGTVAGSVYTAPNTTGTATVRVTDSAGRTATLAIAVTATTTTSTSANETKAIYRLYNSSTGEHLFSASSGELTTSGFVLENQPFKLLTYNYTGTIAIYRCWNGNMKRFITTQSNCEGVAYLEQYLGFAYTSQVSGSVPLYRFYSRTTGDHLATTDLNEGYGAGYLYEGVLGFVLL